MIIPTNDVLMMYPIYKNKTQKYKILVDRTLAITY